MADVSQNDRIERMLMLICEHLGIDSVPPAKVFDIKEAARKKAALIARGNVGQKKG